MCHQAFSWNVSQHAQILKHGSVELERAFLLSPLSGSLIEEIEYTPQHVLKTEVFQTPSIFLNLSFNKYLQSPTPC